MRILIFLMMLLLLVAACSSEKSLTVDETIEKNTDVQEVPLEEESIPSQPSVVPNPDERAEEETSNRVPLQEQEETTGSTPGKTKTEELLDVMYEKIKNGVSYRNKGDRIYLKGPKEKMKMTIAFGQMFTIPGSQRTDYALADQIDIAYFDLATGKGKGYCLARIEGSEFSCGDLQNRAFDLKFSDFYERSALYHLEQRKDVDPDVYQRKAERSQGVATSRLEYGQGTDQVIIWISDYHKMPIKIATRIKDPYTQETHYEDWEFGVSNEIMIDPFA
ncbi:hypothetical protein J4410_00130 [Candidatus Woesearchaeota archaeon]|nr:hypothetical protein [Candidatus Woesearchaeota archaeon]